MSVASVLQKVVNTCCNIIPRPRHNSCRKRVCENMRFPHDCLDVSCRLNCRPWKKSKSPCPCRNCTFPKSLYHHRLESTWPVALCFPGPDDAPHQGMCDFHMCMGFCYIITAFELPLVSNLLTVEYACVSNCWQCKLMSSHASVFNVTLNVIIRQVHHRQQPLQ